MAAAEGNENVCPADSPEHAELLEPGTDYGLASGFDDTGADKQVLAAKLGVAHALGISLQVIISMRNFSMTSGLVESMARSVRTSFLIFPLSRGHYENLLAC
jgi:hypothetical protein